MLTFQFLFAGLIAIALGGLMAPIVPPDLSQVGSVVIGALVISLLIILPAIFMIFWASQFLFPGRVGLLLMAEVVVAVVSASILLPEESLRTLQWGASVKLRCEIPTAAWLAEFPRRPPR